MKFYYRARTKEGKIQSGIIEAFSKQGALDVLAKYGFYATALRKAGRGVFLQENINLNKTSLKDIAIFTRQLAVMLKSSIPPIEALRTQVGQIENSQFREKVLKIAEMVETGSSLSQSFASYPDLFDSFFVSCIKSGEVSGNVSDSLNYLADHLDNQYTLQERIKGAMIYPIVVIFVFIGIFFLAMLYIIPRLTDILKSFGDKLPVSTQIIISLSDFTRAGGWIIFVLLFASLFFLPQYIKKSGQGKLTFDKLKLKLPIFGEFFKKTYLARFADNLSILISSGIPIAQALKITKDIIDNRVYKNILDEAIEKVSRGESIYSVLSHYPEQVPSFLSQMVYTGEKSGNLEKTLDDAADFYNAEISRFVENLSKIIEPLLILFLGLMVGVLVISIFIPLTQLGMGNLSSF
jgi:type IV pilus assembly protein PilC